MNTHTFKHYPSDLCKHAMPLISITDITHGVATLSNKSEYRHFA